MSKEKEMEVVMNRIVKARLCWWLGRRYDEALQTYAQIEGYLERISPEDEAEVEKLNTIKRMFHEEAGRFLRVIGQEEKAKEHMRLALALFPADHLIVTSLLEEEVPISDPEAAVRELKKQREDHVKGLPYPASPALHASSFVRLAEIMMEMGMTEAAHKTLTDFLELVKKAEDEWDDDRPMMSPGGSMSPRDCLTVSYACELLGNEEEARSYLNRAAEAMVATIEWVEKREKNSWMKALVYEEAGTIFEKLEPRKALECYDTATEIYAKGLTEDNRRYGYSYSSYDLEFRRQLGYLWPLFRFDIFARLALRRQRLLAVIDGEVGYPLWREPRTTSPDR